MKEQRIDRIERAIEAMMAAREDDRAIITELKESEKLQNRILTSLEANQIVMQQEIKGLRHEVSGLRDDFKVFTRAINDIVDAFKFKLCIAGFQPARCRLHD